MGHGHQFLGSIGPVANQFLGGWQLSSIFRWNTGVPEVTPYDSQTWATNWKKPSSGVRIRPIEASPTKSGDYPNLFADRRMHFRVSAMPEPVKRENGTFSVARVMFVWIWA